jgi:hypothetical protein
MPVWLGALDSFTTGTLTLPGGTQLQNQDVFFKFRNGSKHLADQAAGGVVTAGQIDAIGGQDARTDPRELPYDDLLDHQVTR